MLHPVDLTTLSSNPQFETLYRDLTANKLNPDGTSKPDSKTQRERDAITDDLCQARIQDAKRTLIRSGLSDVAYRGHELPDELRQSVAITVALLEGKISPSDHDIIAEDLEVFQQNLPDLATALGTFYTTSTSTLARLLNPSQAPLIPQLSTHLLAFQATLADLQTSLQTSRLALASQLPALHATHLQLIARSIVILERNIHGATSRALKAKAEYFSLVATGMGKKIALQDKGIEGVVCSREVKRALETRAEGLRKEGRGLGRECREAEERLGSLRGVGGMEGVAREIREVREEVERVRGEIRRLEER